MNKKIFAVVLAIVISICTLSFMGCKRTKFELVEPDGGYTVTPGGSVKIEYKAASQGVVTFEIKEGADYVEEMTNGGELTVLPGKEMVGKIIKVAVTFSDDKETITLETTVKIVDIKLTAINLSIPWVYVYPDTSTELTYTLVPANTTQDDITIEIISGSASYIDGEILVPQNAAEGEIKVKAYRGNISSDILTIQIKLPSNDPYYVDGPENSKVESGARSQTSFDVIVKHDLEGTPVYNVMVEFSVTKGKEFLSVTSKGWTCYLKVLGHGTAEVTARLMNGKTYTTQVKCVKTPSRLDLPDFLTGKSNINYTVGKDQPFEFDAVVPQAGENALSCRDVVYSFAYMDEPMGGAPAIYEKNETTKIGKITFSATGRIKVTATTDSKNSNGEVETSRIFIVNDGINVSTFEELKTALEDTANSGKNINIVATKFITGYGCNLVPRLILDNNNTTPEALAAGLVITCPFEVSLNGNGHAIDISKLQHYPWSENLTGLLFFKNSNGGFGVKIKDLVMRGNAGIDGKNPVTGDLYTQNVAGQNGDIVGVHEYAIKIGDEGEAVYYTAIIENVKIYSFNVGIDLNRTLSGSKCSNIEIDDCFKHAMHFAASIVELNNMTFGNYGGFGIEPTYRFSNEAKETLDGENTNQKITLTGNTKVANKNAGNTRYFNGYKFMDRVPMTTIIDAFLISLDPTDTQISHIKNKNNETSFFIFIFMNPEENLENYSKIIAEDGNIATFDECKTVQTDARFIEVSISIKDSQGHGDLSKLGSLMLFNMNYKP